MGKQRTPQGRPAGRGRAPAGAAALSLVPPAPEAGPAPEPVTVPPEAALHEHLMDSVSPRILSLGSAESGESVLDAGAPPPAPAPVPADALAAMPAPPAADLPDASIASVTALEPALEAESAPAVPSVPAERPEERSPPSLPMPAPAAWRAGAASGGAPIRRDIEGMGETLFAFLRSEGTAAVAHLQAMAAVRSPADAIRLQVGEIQRAADASLTCWSDLARRAGRLVSHR